MLVLDSKMLTDIWILSSVLGVFFEILGVVGIAAILLHVWRVLRTGKTQHLLRLW